MCKFKGLVSHHAHDIAGVRYCFYLTRNQQITIRIPCFVHFQYELDTKSKHSQRIVEIYDGYKKKGSVDLLGQRSTLLIRSVDLLGR